MQTVSTITGPTPKLDPWVEVSDKLYRTCRQVTFENRSFQDWLIRLRLSDYPDGRRSAWMTIVTGEGKMVSSEIHRYDAEAMLEQDGIA
jgi:major membrane immunogen (membrane-anchored lipoprotein)